MYDCFSYFGLAFTALPCTQYVQGIDNHSVVEDAILWQQKVWADTMAAMSLAKTPERSSS